MTISFNRCTSVKLNDNLLQSIRSAVHNNPETYGGIGHFIRVAIIKELRRSSEKK